MTPNLTTLLCLGEMRTGGKPWSGRDRAPQPGPGQSGDPRPREAHGEEGSAQDSGLISHGDSLLRLSVGPRTCVQASESFSRVPRSQVLMGNKGPPLRSWRWRTAGLMDGECLECLVLIAAD